MEVHISWIQRHGQDQRIVNLAALFQTRPSASAVEMDSKFIKSHETSKPSWTLELRLLKGLQTRLGDDSHD